MEGVDFHNYAVWGVWYVLCCQVVLSVTDYHAEGYDAYHPVKKTGTYDSQKDKAKAYTERFKMNRMPK